MNKKFGLVFIGLLLMALIGNVLVSADSLDALENAELTEEEEALLNQGLTPVAKVINALQYSFGILAVLAVVIAGFMFAFGKPETKEKAKKAAIWIFVGGVAIQLAFVITRFLVG